MAQGLGEDGQLDLGPLESSELVLVVQAPDEDLDVAERVLLAAEAVQAGPTSHRGPILQSIISK